MSPDDAVRMILGGGGGGHSPRKNAKAGAALEKGLYRLGALPKIIPAIKVADQNPELLAMLLRQCETVALEAAKEFAEAARLASVGGRLFEPEPTPPAAGPIR